MTGALNITDTHSGQVCVVALSSRIDSSNANDLMSHLTSLKRTAVQRGNRAQEGPALSALGQTRDDCPVSGGPATLTVTADPDK